MGVLKNGILSMLLLLSLTLMPTLPCPPEGDELLEENDTPLDPLTLISPANPAATAADAAAFKSARSAAMTRNQPGMRAAGPAAQAGRAAPGGAGGAGEKDEEAASTWPVFVMLDANCAESDMERAVGSVEGRPCYLVQLPAQRHLHQVKGAERADGRSLLALNHSTLPFYSFPSIAPHRSRASRASPQSWPPPSLPGSGCSARRE